MGKIVVVTNPFSPEKSTKEYLWDGRFIDWLQEKYPQGFNGFTVVCAKNVLHLPVEDYDTYVGQDDVIAMVVQPGQQVWTYIIQALIQAVIAYAINYLFNRPKTPGKNAAASPTYSFGSLQNEARLGEPIPVVYGEVVLVPLYASQPYVYYRNNAQYLVLLFALSRGNVDVENVYVADSDVDDMPIGIVRWQVYKPADHLKTIGTIGADFGIYENVVSPVEVQDIDMQRSSDTIYRTMNFNAPDKLIHTEKFPDSFAVGETLTVLGSLSNDGQFTITARGDGGRELTLSPAVVAEAPFTSTFTASFAATGDFEAKFTLSGNVLPTGIKEGMKCSFSTSGGIITPVTNAYVEMLTTTGESGFAEIGIRMVNPYSGDAEIASRSWDVDFTTGPFSVSVGAIDDGYRGWYAICKPGVVVNKIETDIAFPNGMFRSNSDGEFILKTVTWRVEIQPIDDNGNVIGPATVYIQSQQGATQTAQRTTYVYEVDEGRYRVRLKRLTTNDTVSTTNSVMYWVNLKGYVPYDTSFDVYGDTTILAVEAKATSGLSGSAQTRFRARCRRTIPTLASDFATEAFSDNPAEVFADIMLDSQYGAGRQTTDLDLDNINDAYTAWEGTNGFNAVFDGRTTVFDAAAACLMVNRGQMSTYNRQFSILREVPIETSSYLFAPTTMLAESFAVSYKLAEDYESDGIRVAFRDPDDFVERYALYPADSLSPDQFTLFGCTNYDHAYGYAKYLWLQLETQRAAITFDTELDGFLPEVGNRITVCHPAVTWGNATRALAVTATAFGYGLTLESPITEQSTGAVWVYMRDRNGVLFGPVVGEITDDGASIRVPSVPVDLPDLVTAQDEPMTVAYGFGEDFAKHYVISEIAPQDSRKATISATRYVPELYVDTIPLPEWL